jgi:hypothetical protein
MVPAKEPGWHGAQVRLFAMEEKVPSGHGEQRIPLRKLPGWQFGAQLLLLLLPAGEVVPSGHAVQVTVPRVSA